MLPINREVVKGVRLSRDLYEDLRTMMRGTSDTPALEFFPESRSGLRVQYKFGVRDETFHQLQPPSEHLLYDVEISQGWSQLVRLTFRQSELSQWQYELCRYVGERDLYPYFAKQQPAFGIRLLHESAYEYIHFAPAKLSARESPAFIPSVWKLKSGEIVIDRRTSHIHPRVHKWLPVAFAQTELCEGYVDDPGNGTVRLRMPLGDSVGPCCYRRTRHEMLIRGRLFGRPESDRRDFVREGGEPLPDPTGVIAVIAPMRVWPGAYEVVTAFQDNTEPRKLAEGWLAYKWGWYASMVDRSTVEFEPNPGEYSAAFLREED